MSDVEGFSRWHRRIVAELVASGLRVDTVRQKRHIVITGTLNDEPFRWVTSKTPSSRNAYRKMLGDLRRAMKQCGVEEAPQFAIQLHTGTDQLDRLWELIREGEEIVGGANQDQ